MVLQALMGCLIILDGSARLLHLVWKEWSKQGAEVLLSFILKFLPGTGFLKIDNTHQQLNRDEDRDTGIDTANNKTQTQTDDFKTRVNHSLLTVELLDGGLCLDQDDLICQDDTTPIQKAIASALSQSAEIEIEKLELSASFMRADLDYKMISSLLEILPINLVSFQIGGASLTVQDLARILRHPSLKNLKNLTLCDVEFLSVINDNTSETEEEDDFASFESRSTKKLALEKVLCLFARLQNNRVTFDPLLEELQNASALEHFELVLDHNHSYRHGRPQEENEQEDGLPVFSEVCLEKFLSATSQLKNLVLEFTPLYNQHLSALSSSLSLNIALKDLRIVNDQNSQCVKNVDWTAFSEFLSHQTSLRNVSLDGITSKEKNTSLLLRSMTSNASIKDLRLRNLPLQLDSLKTYLSTNASLQSLFLHGNTYLSDDKKQDPGKQLVGALVAVLEEHNITLQRISYKEGMCARTDVYPLLRKPKAWRYNSHSLRAPDQKTLSLRSQIHWYLTLNQRGIRQPSVMLNISQSPFEFLQLVVQQQKEEDVGCKDAYDLDCIFHLMKNNPSLCSSAL